MPVLISIVGPTAVGKTSLSLFLARKFQTEILSCDSRQIYRYMDIGTAKPGKEILREVPHHFIDMLDPDEEYSAGRFEAEADALLQRLFQQHEVVVAVGGSTLYVDALWNGMDDMPAIAPELREALRSEWQQEGLAPLLSELKQVDPETFEKVDRSNPARVLRALEVYRATGKPISMFRQEKKEKQRNYHLIKIGLDLDRKVLYERINQRVDQMLEEGLLEEVRNLLSMGYSPRLNALQTIGYQEFIEHLQGKISFEEAVVRIKRNSRRYAKRQLTWYRRYPDIQWFDRSVTSEEEIAFRV